MRCPEVRNAPVEAKGPDPGAEAKRVADRGEPCSGPDSAKLAGPVLEPGFTQISA